MTIFQRVLVLLLSYKGVWGTLSLNKLLSMGSYDFVTADLEKKVGLFFGPLS